MKLGNYYLDEWVFGKGEDNCIYDSFNGDLVAVSNTGKIPFEDIFNHARSVGCLNLQKMSFTERGRMLKVLAEYLSKRKSHYYKISLQTGATKRDSWFDIDGGIGVLFSYSSLRRLLPNENFFLDGKSHTLSKNGEFIGHHILVPKNGVAVHINAFNFPVWGMLEKISSNLMAGVPAVIKPSTQTCQLTNLVFKDIIESKILPKGALQLICGKAKGILDKLYHQDVVTFTGSAEVGTKLKSHPEIINKSIHFNLEADSLNCSVLGTDSKPGTPEFDIYVDEIVKEITIKCGQKCTAIRRAIIPAPFIEDVIKAIKNRLISLKIGDPRVADSDMGALAGTAQVFEVKSKLNILSGSSELCLDGESFMKPIVDYEKGAYFHPKVFIKNNNSKNYDVHNVEAFGPITSILPYNSIDEAIELAKKGNGSLCSSIITNDENIAKKYVMAVGSFHGRILVLNRYSKLYNTGHGVALPLLNHGGPGRAGGGQELGGIRSIQMYMQLCAIQGTPTMLTKITNEYQAGAEQKLKPVHIFYKHFEELEIGETVITKTHVITEKDIDEFANVTGDYFYAHMDKSQLGDTLFENRVAHGYYVLSRATGLYVPTGKCPVLLNYGLEECRFIKPVYPGMEIRATLTVKHKNDISKEVKDGIPRGIVKFHLQVKDDNEDIVLTATTIAVVKRKSQTSNRNTP